MSKLTPKSQINDSDLFNDTLTLCMKKSKKLKCTNAESETRKKLFRAKARRHSTTLQTVSLIVFLLLLPQFIKLYLFVDRSIIWCRFLYTDKADNEVMLDKFR